MMKIVLKYQNLDENENENENENSSISKNEIVIPISVCAINDNIVNNCNVDNDDSTIDTIENNN